MSYQKPPGPRTALASFPGSGNTWLRYLLQQATGLYTGSIYRDQALLRHGFPAETVKNGSVILVKTHEWGAAARSKFSRAVLLVRDPYASILAEFNRQAGGHVGHATLDKYVLKQGKFWKDFVMGKSRSWLETNLDWLKFNGSLHVLRYEHLVAQVEPHLNGLLAFLNLQHASNNRTMRCVLSHREGIYKRKRKDLNFDPYDGDMKANIERNKLLFATALKLLQDGFKTHMADFIDSVLRTI